MMRRLMMGSLFGSCTAASQSLFVRMTTPPTPLRQVAINNLISTLIIGGVWGDLDALYVFAAADSQAALLNWKSASYTATNNGASFTADEGYTGNASSAYLDTGYGPGDDQFAQDDHSFGRFVRTAGTTGVEVGVSNVGAGNAAFQIAGAITKDGLFSASKSWGGGRSGSFLVSRSSGTAYDAYRSSVSLGSNAEASLAVTSFGPFFILAERDNAGSAGSFTDAQVSAAHFGKSLTSGQAIILQDALQAYMTEIGA